MVEGWTDVFQSVLLLDLITISCSLNCCSWRALRVQKISSDEVVQLPKSSLSISKNKWQDGLWSFDIKEEDGHETDDDIDLEELGRALSEAANLTSTGKKQNNDAKSSRKSLPTGQSARSVGDKIPGKLLISV